MKFLSTLLAALIWSSVALAQSVGPGPVPSPWSVSGNTVNYPGNVTFGGTLTGNISGGSSLPISSVAGLGAGVATLLGQAPSGSGRPVGNSSPSIGNPTITGSFTATGLVTNADLANPSTTVNGQTCTLGGTCTITSGASSLVIGTTTISSGTPNGIIYDAAGLLGNLATGNNGVLVTSSGGVPSIATTLPSSLTIPSATINGATSNGLTMTGTLTLGSNTLSGVGGTVSVGLLKSVTASHGTPEVALYDTTDAGWALFGQSASLHISTVNNSGAFVADAVIFDHTSLTAEFQVSPTAPTPAYGDSSTKVATTAFFFKNLPTVQVEGADTTGGASACTAFSAAVTALGALSPVGGTIQVPAGAFNLASCQITASNMNIRLMGAGQGATQVIFTGTANTGGIAISQNSAIYSTMVDDMSVWTTVNQTTTSAITVTYPSGSYLGQLGVFSNIDIADLNDAYTNYWNVGIYCAYCSAGVVRNIEINGNVHTNSSSGVSASNTNYGVYLKGGAIGVGSNGFLMDHVQVYDVNYCAYSDGDNEGVIFVNGNCVGTNHGYFAVNGENTPSLFVQNNAFANYYDGVNIAGIDQGMIANNVFYKRPDSAQNWIGVVMGTGGGYTSALNIVHDNYFVGFKGTAAGGTAIAMYNASGAVANDFHHNIIQSVDYVVDWNSGASQNYFTDNIWQGTPAPTAWFVNADYKNVVARNYPLLTTDDGGICTATGATPNISGGLACADFYLTNSGGGGGTSVTALSNGYPGQIASIIAGDANTIYTQGAALQMFGGVNYHANSGDISTFIYDNGNGWREIARLSSIGTFSSGNVSGNLSVGGILSDTNTTQSTSTITGAITDAGGLGVVKNAYIGGLLSVGQGTVPVLVNAPATTTASQIVPNSATTTSTPALVVGRYTTYSGDGTQTSPTLYVATSVAMSSSTGWTTGIDSEAEITANTVASAYTESIRGRCVVDAVAQAAGCWGGSFVAYLSSGAPNAVVFGVESEVSQFAVDAPAPTSYNPSWAKASYIADAGQGDSGKIIDAAYLVNGAPYNGGFQAGFECPVEGTAGTVVRYSCFYERETSTYGIKLDGIHTASIVATGLYVDGTQGNAYHGVVNTTQILALANDASHSYVSAVNKDNVGADNSYLYLTANGPLGFVSFSIDGITTQTNGVSQVYFAVPISITGSSTGYVILNTADAGATNYTATLPANTGTLGELNFAQTWTAVQSFNSGDLALKGSSSGVTTLNANSASGTQTATLPANSGIIAELNYSQTWSATQTFNNADLLLAGSASGAITLEAPAAASAYVVTFPAATDTLAALGTAQTFTAVQTFTNSDFALLGSSTGYTTFTSANASGTNYTITFPAATSTVAILANAQTFSGAKTFSNQIINTAARTIASAAGAILDDVTVTAETTTISGATNITTSAGFDKVSIYAPTYSAASALTITNAATLYVDGAPVAGGAGPVSITNNWAISVGSGNVSFPGTGNVVGTITSGTWHGGVVGATYGGTGVNNGSSTLTLAASLTTTGTGAPTLAFPATTSYTYTLPANTGTLAELNFAQSWTATQTFQEVSLGSSYSVDWNSDLYLTRAGAAFIKFGQTDAASPVAQTLGVQGVVAGTSNTAGANLTIAGSQGTGTGAGGSIILQVAPAGTTGTAQNAEAAALTIDSTKTATFAYNINANKSSSGILLSTAILAMQEVDGTGAGIAAMSSAAPSQYIAYRTDGTFASKTAVQNGDSLGIFSMGGYDGSASHYNQANIRAAAAANWVNATTYATQVTINATPAASVSTEAEATFGGGVSIGGNTLQGVGTINATTYYAGATVGVTCSGTPTSSFASKGGIVTHC